MKVREILFETIRDMDHAMSVLDIKDAAHAKKAYRRAASQHHPDKGGDREKFEKAHAAHEYIKKNGSKPKAKPAYQKWSPPDFTQRKGTKVDVHA